MDTQFRSHVLQFAHQLYQKSLMSFCQCLKLAWKAYRMSKRMSKEPVRFAYLKKDGTFRKARCRVHPDTFKDRSPWRGGVFVYYDLDCEGYRSFRVQNLLWAK